MIHHPVRDRSLLVAAAQKWAGQLHRTFKKWRKHEALDQLGSVIHYHCCETGLALEAIGKHGLSGELEIALSELQRWGDDLQQGKRVRNQFDESIDFFAQVVSAIRVALDPKPQLNMTDRAIAELVFKEGPLPSKEIAARLPPGEVVSEPHVRKIFSGKLKLYGFFNLRDNAGYRAPSRRTWI